jgi:hypothetical protein
MILYKYPRTPHLPWSPGVSNDDRVLDNVDHFEDKLVAVSKKMDGENTSLYPDHIHARSMGSVDHPSRHWVKALHSRIKHEIPEGWRICGENLYAKHSIHYTDLFSYFAVFSIWNDGNMCMPWNSTMHLCSMLDLWHIPIIYIGKWGSDTRSIIENRLTDTDEGYVVRAYDGFHYDDFEISVAKYVRENHVQTDQHWMHSKLVKNILREET